MMSDNQLIKGDVNQAASMIKSMLNEKYIAPISRAIASENKKARKNPGREARLLDALKPFMDAKTHEAADRTINMLFMMETFRGLSSQLPRGAYVPPKPMAQLSTAVQESSLRDDGIYDMDERCLQHKKMPTLAPIFVMIALACSNGL